MTRVRAALAARLLLVPLACGACGLVLTHGPPNDHATRSDFHCTTNLAGPVLDALTATVSIGLAFKSVTEQPDYDTPAINSVLVVGVARTTLWGISAVVGFDKVSRCSKAQRQRAERRSHAPPTGALYPPVYSAGVQTVVVTPAVDTLSPEAHVQLVAKAIAPGGGVYVNKSFRWSSSNDAIASVGDSGMVTAHAPGTVLIAANADNVVGTARLVVLPPPDGAGRASP